MDVFVEEAAKRLFVPRLPILEIDIRTYIYVEHGGHVKTSIEGFQNMRLHD